MQVILQEDVPNLGKAGDIVSVREGYGRNFLLPKQKAVVRQFDLPGAQAAELPQEPLQTTIMVEDRVLHAPGHDRAVLAHREAGLVAGRSGRAGPRSRSRPPASAIT